MTQRKKIEFTVPASLLKDINRLAKSNGISQDEFISRAVSKYIAEFKYNNLRKQLEKGYEEMAAINIEWAENCLAADSECQLDYEEKLSECE